MFRNLINDLPYMLMRIPIILLSLTVHEIAHGWVAYKLGDPTARSLGRLSLNPLKHLDPIGTVMMLIFGFGWAKPVPINTRYFKKPRRDMALTAFAGPVSNLIMAFFGLFVYAVCVHAMHPLYAAGNMMAYVIIEFMGMFYSLNLYLAVFNLLPVPPLDGSRLLFIFLPDKYYFGLMKYERFIMIILMVLLYTGTFTQPIQRLANLIGQGMIWVVGLIPFL